MVDAVDRHADAVQQRGAGDDDLRVAHLQAVVGDDARRHAAREQQPRQPQRHVQHDLDVHPRVVGHVQALGVDAGGVPPRLDLQVGVDGVEQLLQAPVAARGRVHARVLRRARARGPPLGVAVARSLVALLRPRWRARRAAS